ncbi:uncharacterized protein LOC144739588 [Lampetra planeri]
MRRSPSAWPCAVAPWCRGSCRMAAFPASPSYLASRRGLPAWHLAGRRVERGASRALPHRPGGPAARDRRLPHAREDGAHPPGPPLPSRGHLFYKFGITECDWCCIKLNIDAKCCTAWRRKQLGQSLAVKGRRGTRGTRGADAVGAAVVGAHGGDRRGNFHPSVTLISEGWNRT